MRRAGVGSASRSGRLKATPRSARRRRGLERRGEQGDHEGGAPAGIAVLDLDSPAERLDDALGHGQTEPGAVEVQPGGARAAIERLEDAPAVGSRDAGSAIAHANSDARPSVAAARRRLDLDADEASGFTVLERVADDVVERAAQRVGLSERASGLRGLAAIDGEAFLVDGEAVVLDHAIDDRAEIDGLDRSSATTGGGGAGEVEDLCHQRAEAVRLPFDQAAVAADCSGSRTTPSARLSAADAIDASGVRSSWVTPAISSISRRARLCARRARAGAAPR